MTTTQTSRLNSIARRYTRLAIDGRREDANRFLAAGLLMLERGIEAGVDRDFLDDAARSMHDAMSNLDARMQKDMDEAGLFYEYQCLDLSELDAIIARLR
jgi:hypothetical protein